MKTRRLQLGEASSTVIAIIVIVAVIVVVYIIVNVANDYESGGTGNPANPEQAACFTKCTWFTEKNCENGRNRGVCFPTWGCGDGIGAHICEK